MIKLVEMKNRKNNTLRGVFTHPDNVNNPLMDVGKVMENLI